MVNKGKLPVILLMVLLLFSLALAGGGFFLLMQERTKNISLQEELEEIKTRQKIAESRYEESKKTIAALEARLTETKTQMDKISQELQDEKTAKLEALAKIEQLRVDLEQQKELRTDLEKNLIQAQKDVKSVQTQLQDLQSQKDELQKKVSEIEVQGQEKTGVELGKIVVGGEGQPQTGAVAATEKTKSATPQETASGEALEGKVLVINKDYNFVVVNLGSEDGIELNSVFSVFHDNKHIGDVKVEKVHETMSAAGFVTAGLKDKVSEGDKVVKKAR